jgi:hypothetical protein
MRSIILMRVFEVVELERQYATCSDVTQRADGFW